MADEKIQGAAELSFAKEVLGLVGDHVKVAADGTPEGMAKTAKGKKDEKPVMAKPEGQAGTELKKISSMNMLEVFNDPNFRRGVMNEIESSRHIWEPAVEAYVRARTGRE